MMNSKNLAKYFEEPTSLKDEKNRTINIPGSLHSFYKGVSSSFDVTITDLITNILVDWQETHSEEIRSELIKNIKKQF